MKNFVSVSTEAKRWEKISNSVGSALFFLVEKKDRYHWIKLGQSFQRFGLKAAKYHINHPYVNMPCKEQQVREKLIRDFHLKGLTPLLLIRFGFSKPMPYSFRRNINNLLAK